MRIKRGVVGARRRKKILSQTKGYWGARSKQYRTAKQAWMKAGLYAYRDRRQRRRDLRRLWIMRVNAAARQHGMSYSKFINGLKRAGVTIDRKMLAYLAVHDWSAFSAIARVAREALAEAAQAA